MRLRRRVRLLSAATLSLLLAAPLSAQQTGRIAARAVDGATNRPHPDVQVVASGGGANVSGITERNGIALLEVPPGTYTVTFRSLGFEDAVVSDVVVRAGETVNVNTSLVVRAFSLGGIIVSTGRTVRKDTEGSNTNQIITAEEITKRPAASPVQHLEGTVGVDLIKQGVSSYNPVVRGFNNIFSGALHALTDNRIAGIPSLRVNLLHFVPSNDDDLARIEVVLGPGSALYGPNTANGVLHLVTKSPLNEQGTTVSVAGGEQSLFKGMFRSAHLLSDDFGFKISGSYFRGDDWAFDDPTEAQARAVCDASPQTCLRVLTAQDPGASQAQLQERFDRIGLRDNSLERFGAEVRADWNPDDASTLIFQGGVTSASGVELTGIGAGRTENWLYSYLQTRFSRNRLFAQAYLNMTDAGDSFLVRQGVPLTDKSKMFVSQLQHGMGFGRSFGARQRADFTYGADLFVTRPETEGDINGQYEDDDNVNELGVYVQGEFILNDHWELIGAARVDNSSLLDEAVFSPRAAVLYKPADNHTLRATYNRAFSMPTTLNYFLDINGGLASGGAGSLGYFLRALGTGKDGFSFMRDGQVAGIRSPFTPAGLGGPGQLLPFDEATIQAQFWPVVLGVLQQSGQATPQLLQLLGSFQGVGLNLLDPATGTVSSTTTPIPDTPPLEESITNTFEVGYQGNFNDRIRVAADVYYTKRENFTSPLVARSPLVVFDGQEIAGRLIQAGLDQATAAAIARAAGSIPVAVVSSDDVVSPTADIIASYINFGELDYFGADLAIQTNLNDNWSLGAAVSWIEEDFFLVDAETDQEVEDFDEIEDLNEVVGLNAPNFKWSADVGFRNAGFTANGRIRYSAEFGANSADFIGVACLPLSTPLRASLEGDGLRDCVDAYTVVDLGIGYEIGSTGTEILLDVTNLFDEGYETFVGVPQIGRLAILQVRKTF